MTKLLNDRTQQQKEFIMEFCKIENNFIDQLHKSRLQTIRKLYLGNLEEKDLKLVEEIYKNKNSKCLIGK